MKGHNPTIPTKVEAEVTPKYGNRLTYKGFSKAVNKQPNEYIEIFVSDWNKDYWAFYVYISQDNYEEDIQNINNLITKLNYRDGDIYIELIDRTEGLEHFYKHIYEINHYTDSDILNLEMWEILEDKGDEHFLYFNKLNGSSEISELRDTEYMTFEDWYDVLENTNPDLYKTLDENNGLGCFDIEHFYNCSGLYEIDGIIVEEVY